MATGEKAYVAFQLHLILPAVLTCQLTKLSPDLEKQWALREYCGNIIAHILRHFDASENIILPRVIGQVQNK